MMYTAKLSDLARSRSLADCQPCRLADGLIVNEIGLEDSISELIASWLQPVAAALFPGIGSRLDSHHSVT